MTDYLIPPIHADMLHESRYSCNLNYNPTHFYQERIISIRKTLETLFGVKQFVHRIISSLAASFSISA